LYHDHDGPSLLLTWCAIVHIFKGHYAGLLYSYL
jgi:hypothetical protein